MGAARLESLLKEAGLNKQSKRVDADMPAGQQAKFVNRFNNSDYAKENNLHLNTNNSMMSRLEQQPDSGRMGTAVAAVIIPGATTFGPGDLFGGRVNDAKMSSNSNNNNTPMSSSSNPASNGDMSSNNSGNMSNNSGNMSNNSGPMSASNPAPAMGSTQSSPPSQSGGSSGGGSMSSSGGGGGMSSGGGGGMSSGGGGGGMGMSDINLKDNIQLIDNALNRLFKINLNNGILS